MRLDKFLKVSRIIKRRPVAKEACEGGRVKVNENTAKAGTEVMVGDVIEIAFGDKVLKVKVSDLKEHVKKEEADNLYEIIQ